jgi:hypothetical protein
MLRKVVVAALALAVVWLWTTPAAYADDWNKATRITVNQPFEIPGMILPAGTYVIKIVDLAAERHVVRFLSEDESKIYATLIAIPDFRLVPTEKTAITFYESEMNRPRPLHSWFYPGYQYGIEFAYPEKRAMEIAKAVEEPVIAFKTPESPVVIEELLAEPLVEVTPQGEEVEVAAVYPEFTTEQEPEVEGEVWQPLSLPRTATVFPLLGLIGLAAAGAAWTIRCFHW